MAIVLFIQNLKIKMLGLTLYGRKINTVCINSGRSLRIVFYRVVFIFMLALVTHSFSGKAKKVPPSLTSFTGIYAYISFLHISIRLRFGL